MTSHTRVEVPRADLRAPLARPDLQAHYIMGMYWRTATRAEQCWPWGISGLRRCSGSSGAWRGETDLRCAVRRATAEPAWPASGDARNPGRRRIRCAKAIREIVSGDRRFESEVAAMTAQGSHAHHHVRGHRMPAAARCACPRGPAWMRQKRIRDQPPGCGSAPTTEAQAPAADSPGREPDHGASR
jgi:hypothetical protein